jgi:tetratricopeptide (TPR) repeat protein
MARKIQSAVAALILATALAAFSQAQSAANSRTVDIVLPPDVKLAPGDYRVEVDVRGKKVAATVKVADVADGPTPGETISRARSPDGKASPAADEPAGGDSIQGGSASSQALMMVLAATAPILFITLGALLYFKAIRPRKHFKPYREALEHMRDKKFDLALPLLTQIEGKLPDSRRFEARFFIAFSYYMLGESDRAERALDQLHRENPKDQNVAYLLGHIRVEEKKYNEAEPVFERMERNGQLGLRHARNLYGVVEFCRAIASLKEGRVEAAADLFEKVEALGTYAGQIPADLRNRHIALGTKALFDRDTNEARKQFETLQRAASRESGGRRDSMAAAATLGLAMAAWLDESSDSYSGIEGMLVDVARLLDPEGPLEMEWVDEKKHLAERLEELDAGAKKTAEERELNRCLRDLHFLRGIAVLREWCQMDGETAHRQIEERYNSALRRLACSRSRDGEFGDVFLVAGLLMFYLHKPGPERNLGVELLEEAQKRGMHEPDAMEIINNHAQAERASAGAVDMYMQVLDKYLHDDTVRKEVRLGLIERLSKYKKVRGWERRPDLNLARSVEPTVAEMRNRSEILRLRVEQVVSTVDDRETMDRVKQLSDKIMQDGQSLYEQAATIERNESELLALTGAQLFKEQ